MTDQKENEFGFEEEDSVPAGHDPGKEMAGSQLDEFDDAPQDVEELSAEFIEQEPDEEGSPETEPARQGSLTRVLLLVLLLLAAAGGLFYYLSGQQEAGLQATLPVQTAKQPIALPDKPAAPPAAVESQVGPPATEAVQAVPVGAAVVAEAPPPKADASSAAAVPPLQEASATTVVLPPEPPVTGVAPTPQPLVGQPQGDYLVHAGAYLLAASLKEAEARIEKLRLPMHQVAGVKVVPMTRLQYGVFPVGQADAKLAELRQVAPQAFKVANGSEFAVCAGSYSSLDKARRFADLLFEKGIEVSEVPVDVQVPLTLLDVGPFISRAAAEAAARQLEEVGLEGQVVRITKTPGNR